MALKQARPIGIWLIWFGLLFFFLFILFTSLGSIMLRFINSIHFSALVLILLTLISTFLAQSIIQTNILALLVTLTIVIKGQQIVDIFMELKNAPSKWRWFMLSYSIAIPCILAIITYI